MNKQLFAFSINRALFVLAYNVGNMFGIIFLYLLFDNSITAAIGGLAVSCAIYAFFLAIFARTIGKIGVRNSMAISIILFFLSFLALAFIDELNPIPYYLTWIIVFSLARTFYNIPYHFFIIKFTDPKKRGNALGKFSAIAILVSIFMPLLGGTVSDIWGIQGLALFSGLVFLLSLVPLFKLPNYKYKFTKDPLLLLGLKNTRKDLYLLIGNDVQNRDRFWDLYVFLLMNGNFLNFGVLLTVINFISFAFSWFFGKLMDNHNRRKILNFDIIVNAIVWLTRPLLFTPVGIAISNSVSQLINTSRGQVVNLIDYDLIRRTGSEDLLDEKLFTREVYLNLVSGFLIAVMILVVVTLGWPAAFILTGLATLLNLLLK